ncbi:MAG: SRPBCC family protein [Bdellovibrionaceae bacterium]|nr:SRPBCC family protein [Pseudobdellovibrionaceae bacterium]
METEMLIRRPVADVFNAVVDPAVTTRFWFTKSSGPLAAGKTVRWTWEMYGVGADVIVHEIVPQRRIVMEWGDPGEMTHVEWTFTSVASDQTVLNVKETGHRGTDDEVVAKVLDSLGGFSLVLAGAKVFLEHGIEARLIHDRFTRPQN